MHVLLVKMSSMGDVIHTLPALTDAMQAIPDLKIDWVVEPAFAEIPAWHPTVQKIIPIALRDWRKNVFKKSTRTAIKNFLKTLRETKYDLIIDAQGLLKSALVAKCARGKINGFDQNSVREKIASFFYEKTFQINQDQHAITRMRELFSKTLQYDFSGDPDYQIKLEKSNNKKYFVFSHGTAWESKHYPDHYWEQLLEKTNTENILVYLPWGNETEKKRAEMLAQNRVYTKVLPKLSLTALAKILQNATAVVSVDTGLGHLSVALKTPTIGLYGPTDPKRVGLVGKNHISLSVQFPCAPCRSKTCWYGRKNITGVFPACYSTIGPDKVWELLS